MAFNVSMQTMVDLAVKTTVQLNLVVPFFGLVEIMDVFYIIEHLDEHGDIDDDHVAINYANVKKSKPTRRIVNQ